MTTLLAIVAVFTPASPTQESYRTLDLANASLADCRRMDGCIVRTTFTVGCPAFSINGVTVVGPGEMTDGTERAVYLPECDADRGDEVTVQGVLRVVNHPAAVVNKQNVPAWVEVRIEEARLLK